MFPTPPVHQQQSGGSSWLQSPAPISMLPGTQPSPTPLSYLPTTDSSGAMAAGLGYGSWWDRTPVQPHIEAPPRLPALRTPGSFPDVVCQQADHSQPAQVAGQSPDSAKSARMAWHVLNMRAGGAVGQREPTAADV